MNRLSRIIGVFLLSAMTLALPGGQAFGLPAAPAHSAGCHDHGGATPAPTPISYRCCASGHHVAVPAASFVQDALAGQNWQGVDDGFMSSALRQHFAAPVVSSNSPPGVAPLRI